MIDDGNPQTISEFPMSSNDPLVALEAYETGLWRKLSICFPVCVYSYDRSTHTVEVMPLVKMGYFDGKWNYIRRQPFKTTIRNIQCGGFTIDYPVYIGDTGWVFSSDRDTLLVKRSGALTNSVLEKDRPIQTVEDSYQQKPNQPKLHTFADGFFIPDNWGLWETHRFKDAPEVSISNALYLGSSIDTKDEDDAGEQEGDGYEQKTTSSIVVQQSGGAFLLSSTPKETDTHSKVSVVGDTAEMSVCDNKEDSPRSASLVMGVDSGIVIRNDNFKDKMHFIASMYEDQFTVRLMDIENKKTVSLSFENGNIDITTSDAVNVFSQKDVTIKGAEHAYVTANDARVVAGDNASVSAKTVSASAEETVNVAAGQKINLTAPDEVNIVTASNVKVMAKKESAKIEIQTLSKGANIELKAKGEESTIKISAEGEKASINLDAKGEVSVSSQKTVSLTTSESASVSAPEIALNGNVAINGQLKADGGVQVQGKTLQPGTVQPGDQSAWTY